MNNWQWDKYTRYTQYNKWDFKTPRSYKERYGIDYKPDNMPFYNQNSRRNNIITILLIIIIFGVLIWTN